MGSAQLSCSQMGCHTALRFSLWPQSFCHNPIYEPDFETLSLNFFFPFSFHSQNCNSLTSVQHHRGHYAGELTPGTSRSVMSQPFAPVSSLPAERQGLSFTQAVHC